MIQSPSHIAIGVRDMERSLRFCRDLLGLTVADDGVQQTGEGKTRRVAFLGTGEPGASNFIVLDQQLQGLTGTPAEMGTVGVHHVAFWVDDLAAMAARLASEGAPAMHGPMDAGSETYGEPAGQTFRTAFFPGPGRHDYSARPAVGCRGVNFEVGLGQKRVCRGGFGREPGNRQRSLPAVGRSRSYRRPHSSLGDGREGGRR